MWLLQDRSQLSQINWMVLTLTFQELTRRLAGRFFEVQSSKGLSSGFHLQSEMTNLRS